MIKHFENFAPTWLHNRAKNQLLSPLIDWHYPGFGGHNITLDKACFAKQPFNIATNYEDWSNVDSLMYMLDWWIDDNKEWFQFEGLNRCLINFYTPGQSTGWHTDHESSNFFSLLYYVNESDGGTMFEDKKIMHKENSAILFNSTTPHSPILSKAPRRINVNWIMGGKLL